MTRFAFFALALGVSALSACEDRTRPAPPPAPPPAADDPTIEPDRDLNPCGRDKPIRLDDGRYICP